MKNAKNIQVSADADGITAPNVTGNATTDTQTTEVAHISPEIETLLRYLTAQPGYVGIGIDSGGPAAIPEKVLAKFTFNNEGATTDRLDGVFDFKTVTGQRRISWKNAEGKDEFSIVLEGVTIVTGEGEFVGSVPYAAYQQMVTAGNNNASFGLKRSMNKSETRTYYSVRITGLK